MGFNLVEVDSRDKDAADPDVDWIKNVCRRGESDWADRLISERIVWWVGRGPFRLSTLILIEFCASLPGDRDSLQASRRVLLWPFNLPALRPTTDESMDT